MTRLSPTLLVQLIEDVGVVVIDDASGEEVVIPLHLCPAAAGEIRRLYDADQEYAAVRPRAEVNE
jgi:hypothetical protein